MPIYFNFQNNTYKISLVGDMTDRDLNNYQQLMNQELLYKSPFKIIFDLCNIGNVPLSLINKLGQYMSTKHHKYLAKKKIIASAIIIKGIIIRGLLHILFVIQQPVTPNIITDDIHEAFKFINSH